jgi:isoleucyl-tRNA synthetase
MSKSLGNSLEPQEVIRTSGADIIRLWVASSDYTEEIRLSTEILARVIESYRKIRNTMRYLLANLYDFDPAADRMDPPELEEVDRYILARYAEVATRILRAYEKYDFSTIFQALNAFAAVDLSAFYADVSKDRLYTFAARSRERRSAQTAMFVMAEGLTRLMAPILSFTADELWRYLPADRDREPSVHLSTFPAAADLSAYENDALVGRWTRLIAIRDEVNRALEVARQSKEIGTSLGARVTLVARGEDLDLLGRYQPDLPMLFIVSQVTLTPADADRVAVSVSRADGHKCPRCWRIVDALTPAGICHRCTQALGEVAA